MGGGTKISKRRGRLGQGVGVLKGAGVDWTPLTNYDIYNFSDKPSESLCSSKMMVNKRYKLVTLDKCKYM